MHLNVAGPFWFCYSFFMLRVTFRDLQIWQKSIDMTHVIYQMTKNFPNIEQLGLVSQMRRAAVSVSSNIAEGSQRTTKKEFSHFLMIAKGSLAELFTQLVIAHKEGFCSQNEFESVEQCIVELEKMIWSYNKALSSQ
jgi:four helix bundle protein